MIIAFTGKMGTGKTTAAQLFATTKGDFIIEHFAAPVKKIARECFGWDGVKDEKGRRLLQVIGTEAGRAYDPDIWVNSMRERIERYNKDGNNDIIIDDLRFENEADLVHSLGGCVILIKRETGNKSEHTSERGISNYDYGIDNNGTTDNLIQKIIYALNCK